MSSLRVASFRHPAGQRRCPPHVFPPPHMLHTHTCCPGVGATAAQRKRISLYADDTQFVEITPTVTTTAWVTFFGACFVSCSRNQDLTEERGSSSGGATGKPRYPIVKSTDPLGSPGARCSYSWQCYLCETSSPVFWDCLKCAGGSTAELLQPAE